LFVFFKRRAHKLRSASREPSDGNLRDREPSRWHHVATFPSHGSSRAVPLSDRGSVTVTVTRRQARSSCKGGQRPDQARGPATPYRSGERRRAAPVSGAFPESSVTPQPLLKRLTEAREPVGRYSGWCWSVRGDNKESSRPMAEPA